MQAVRTPQRRADCTPLNALSARRKTRRLRAARRTDCAPKDVAVARRETCRDAPGACRVRAVCACSRGRPSGPAFLCSLESPRAPRSSRGRKAARLAWSEKRGASSDLLRALARLEQHSGRVKVVALRGVVLSCFGRYARRIWSPEKAERRKTAKHH